jgi:hypothetical protein
MVLAQQQSQRSQGGAAKLSVTAKEAQFARSCSAINTTTVAATSIPRGPQHFSITALRFSIASIRRNA